MMLLAASASAAVTASAASATRRDGEEPRAHWTIRIDHKASDGSNAELMGHTLCDSLIWSLACPMSDRPSERATAGRTDVLSSLSSQFRLQQDLRPIYVEFLPLTWRAKLVHGLSSSYMTSNWQEQQQKHCKANIRPKFQRNEEP